MGKPKYDFGKEQQIIGGVKKTPINLLHNRIRTANIFENYGEILQTGTKELYKEYKAQGGKKSLKQLLTSEPKAADKKFADKYNDKLHKKTVRENWKKTSPGLKKVLRGNRFEKK